MNYHLTNHSNDVYMRANGTGCFTQASNDCIYACVCVLQSIGRGRKQNDSFAGVCTAFFIVRVEHLLRCCCRSVCYMQCMNNLIDI